MSSIFLKSIIAMLVCYLSALKADAIERTLAIDTQQTQKYLSNSYLGANAQQFRSHYSFRQLLDQGAAFSTFLSNVGSPILRMDGRSAYGWLSEYEDRKLRGNSADKFGWFSMGEFHRFCRSNGIRIIGAFNDTKYYDKDSDRIIEFKDKPEYFDGAVKNNMARLSWIVKNGYQEMYVAWEIGNECWGSWDPELYAQFARKMANAAIAIQPGIFLNVPVMLRDTDDPAIKTFITKLPRSASWFTWHEKMLPALGLDIEKISHLQIHVYGSASMYSANFRGLEKISEILAKQPNTRHLRYLVTEWRYTGTGGTQHRTYRTGALWNAKFAMILLSYSKVDFSSAHEFLCTSGLGYWSPGNEWIFQYPEEKQTGNAPRIPNKTSLPQFDIGPFGPVNRMLNDLVKECPVLIEHKSDLGPMSSALFAEGKSDLDWFICTKNDRSLLGGIIVNTMDNAVAVTLATGRNHYALMNIVQMACDADKVNDAEIPGEEKNWHVASIASDNGRLLLPANSITSFRGTLRN